MGAVRAERSNRVNVLRFQKYNVFRSKVKRSCWPNCPICRSSSLSDRKESCPLGYCTHLLRLFVSHRRRFVVLVDWTMGKDNVCVPVWLCVWEWWDLVVGVDK